MTASRDDISVIRRVASTAALRAIAEFREDVLCRRLEVLCYVVRGSPPREPRYEVVLLVIDEAGAISEHYVCIDGQLLGAEEFSPAIRQRVDELRGFLVACGMLRRALARSRRIDSEPTARQRLPCVAAARRPHRLADARALRVR